MPTWKRRGGAGLFEAICTIALASCRFRWRLCSTGKAILLDGSFVTAKEQPGDFDACWDIADVDPDRLDPIFFDFENGRAAQKARFYGELFPAQLPEGWSGKAFLEFFQTDKETGNPKGVVGFDLGRWLA